MTAVIMHQSIPAAPTPGTDKLGKCPAVAQVGGGGGRGREWGGDWEQLEVTDALLHGN